MKGTGTKTGSKRASSAGGSGAVAAADPGTEGAEADPRLVEIAKAYVSDPTVSVGKLFASVGLRVRGKIFAMVVRDRLVVKLPKARVDELVARGMAERFDPGHG